MVSGYQEPCRYCDRLVSPGMSLCPLCGRVNPTEPPRCPGCRHPVGMSFVSCPDCGEALQISCPHCGEMTFFGDYCGSCEGRLTVSCPRKTCQTSQKASAVCIACGGSLVDDEDEGKKRKETRGFWRRKGG